MIQRIQTVYLFLAGVLLLGQFALPYAHCTGGTALAGLQGTGTNVFSDAVYNLRELTTFSSLTGVAVAFAIAAIARFKNRLRQMSAVYVTMGAIAILIGGIVFIGYSDSKQLPAGTAVQPDLGGIFPLLSLLFLFLALRGIRKDESLVNSMNRLR